MMLTFVESHGRHSHLCLGNRVCARCSETRAGTPLTVLFGATSLVTIAPAAITAFSPMITRGSSTAPAPILTPSLMVGPMMSCSL